VESKPMFETIIYVSVYIMIAIVFAGFIEGTSGKSTSFSGVVAVLFWPGTLLLLVCLAVLFCFAWIFEKLFNFGASVGRWF